MGRGVQCSSPVTCDVSCWLTLQEQLSWDRATSQVALGCLMLSPGNWVHGSPWHWGQVQSLLEASTEFQDGILCLLWLSPPPWLQFCPLALWRL